MAEVKNKAKAKTRKRKSNKDISAGQCHILASYNNTIVTFTDKSGNTISWASAGQKFKSSRKSTPFAAQEVCTNAARLAKDAGIKTVEVFVKGPGTGREAAIRAIQTAEIDVTSIKDVSPIAHNGCRPPKKRRL